MIDPEIKELLIEEAGRINRPAFINDDPVQFPRRFNDLRDIEITSFLVSSISWGRRSMILRDAERLLALMDLNPYAYMTDEGYEDLDDDLNIHRTFFGRDLKWYLRGLRPIYSKYGSLDSFSASVNACGTNAPAWTLAKEMGSRIADANSGKGNPRCLPQSLKTSPLKRLNMALRWLVRDDGIVDLGVWKSIPVNKLFIPLDVHVGNTARALGLLDRKSNDRRSVEILTAEAREILPDDPALLDFALFGVGVRGETQQLLLPNKR